MSFNNIYRRDTIYEFNFNRKEEQKRKTTRRI